MGPVRHYHDLVAGRGDRGFRDGVFSEALFDRPSGLAIDPAGKRLFVADTGNRRIRVVRLDQQNRVETLAGSGRADQHDGILLKAGFAAPGALAWVPENRMAVADGGRLRLLDLAKRTVTTIVRGENEGNAEAIWGLIHVPRENALYFTQPGLGVVRKLDLANLRVSTVIERSDALPRPAVLCLFNDSVLVSDLDSGHVFNLNSETGKDGTTMGVLRPADRAEGMVGMTVSAGRAYFVAGGLDSWGKLVPFQSVPLMTAFGELFDAAVQAKSPNERHPLINLEKGRPSGFVADPMADRHFFLALPSRNRIISLSDFGFADGIGASTGQPSRLVDFDYPIRKPANTMRILVVGDSRIRDGAPGFDQPSGFDEPLLRFTRMNTFPKKLELLLAVNAALDDDPVRYEVLTVSIVTAYRLIVWPYYVVPGIVKTYGVDVVLILLPSDLSVRGYFETPLTDLGIPSETPDPEYLIKPDIEKLSDPALKRFFQAAEAQQLVTVSPNSQLEIAPLDQLMPHPEIRTELADLVGRPFAALDRALGAGSARKPALYLVYAPFTEVEPVDAFRTLLGDIAKRDGLKVLDLSTVMVGLRTTLYGYTELVGNYHLRPGGHEIVAHVLARQLQGVLRKW